ncbi:MAG: peptidylprolyl isomerase [Pusillimonas sp.]|nr:peptidylprolyl isomerase [Pusillimonas sp.]
MTSSSDSVNVFVQPDSYLTLHYRITIISGPGKGSVFADTFSGNPATLQLGMGQWSPSLEQVLVGRAEGAEFSAEIPAAQAYGDRNPELIQWVGRKLLDQHSEPGMQYEPGDIVTFTSPEGLKYSGVCKEGRDDAALFDFNHPLAGADLRLDVVLLGVM